MDAIIKADLYRYQASTGRKQLIKKLLNPAFLYTFLYRKTAKYSGSSIQGIFFRILKRHFGYLYGVQIPPTTKIGGGLFIGHVGNIVLNPDAVIGNNCNIAQGVTIGQENRGQKKGVPKIGNEVWIGANTVIVGNITIGNNVLIAPNCFVNFDVPNNAVVISSQCSIHPKENATENYIDFKYVTP
ncbi:serine acetyltransferase [Galbibacter sp. PAP.153]|uniref:serine O-acetyltransferase n=1 Tax=Galbibacter sp. PAP.153 TaxID=3104623 RepID=UPI00300B3C45